MKYERHVAVIAHQVEVVQRAEELGLPHDGGADTIRDGRVGLGFIDEYVGAIDARVVHQPGGDDEGVGGRDGEVTDLGDVRAVGGATAGILALQIVEEDHLGVVDAVHLAGQIVVREDLIDAVEGGLQVGLGLIEVVLFNRAERRLIQVGAGAQQRSRQRGCEQV